MVLVARYFKSKATFPPEALKESLPLPLPASGGCWHPLGVWPHLFLLHLHITFSASLLKGHTYVGI